MGGVFCRRFFVQAQSLRAQSTNRGPKTSPSKGPGINPKSRNFEIHKNVAAESDTATIFPISKLLGCGTLLGVPFWESFSTPEVLTEADESVTKQKTGCRERPPNGDPREVAKSRNFEIGKLLLWRMQRQHLIRFQSFSILRFSRTSF